MENKNFCYKCGYTDEKVCGFFTFESGEREKIQACEKCIKKITKKEDIKREVLKRTKCANYISGCPEYYRDTFNEFKYLYCYFCQNKNNI